MDPERERKSDPRRGLPAVARLERTLGESHPELPAWAVRAAARRELAEARNALSRAPARPAPGPAEIAARVARRAGELSAPRPRRVVNATGVVLHTNLGRAPLASGAAAAAAAAAGYGDLELELAGGGRGDRLGSVAEKLVLLSGAEAGLAVNNNAACVLLALDTLARGREVVVSRGELVEIGGSFRVPEILERAGVRLVEVGTTNRTHPEDYARALGPDTALLLKVHRSNFVQEGFVREVGIAELAEIGRKRDLPVVEDLGSGTLVDLRHRGLPPESFAPARLAAGADLVCFSGDKLLGGPQAGIAIGRERIVAAMRRSPLARALRLDKLSLAALDWTLTALLDGRHAEIPALRLLTEPEAALEARARALAERAAAAVGDAARVAARSERSPVGGGSLPGLALPSWVVVVEPASGGASALAARLREAPVPVVGRVRDGALLLDVRALLPGDGEVVAEALRAALARSEETAETQV